MGNFAKDQKRKKRKIKKRVNQQRAAKKELDAEMELQRNILGILIVKDEMIFSPERYWELTLQLSGEEPDPLEYDSQMYWVVVSKLRKLDAWIRNMDPQGRQWEFNLDYVLRVRKQIENGELPAVSMWLEMQGEADEPVVTSTGKVLGDVVDDVQRDTAPAKES